MKAQTVNPWPETDDERASFADWQQEVGNGDTASSFRDWLTSLRDAERVRRESMTLEVLGTFLDVTRRSARGWTDES